MHVETDWSARRSTRRRFLVGALTATIAGRTATNAFAELLAAAPRFRSMPSLDPPVVHVVVAPRNTAAGYIFLANAAGQGQPGPMIIDDLGELIWFRPRMGLTVMNFSQHVLGGKPILAWWEGKSLGSHGNGEYVLLGQDYRELGRVRAANGFAADFHEFSVTTRGSALITGYAPTADGSLLDSVVQEIDIASGALLLEWRASEHIDLAESYIGSTGGGLDFAHLNAAAVDIDGNLLVSSRHTWTIYKVDRSSGAVIWRLGGKRSDFAIGDGAAFSWQHHVRRHTDGSLTVFDNGAGVANTEPFSRGLRLLVDEKARTATLAEQLVHPDRFLSSAMGSMEVLDDGGGFVGWGSTPRFSEFAADGTLRFDAGYPGGGFTYRAFRRAWTGTPATRPALTVAAVGGVRSAYVSWSGATEVASWRLLGGSSKTALAGAAVTPKLSFETRLPLRPSTRWIAAEALDERGRVLGRSAVVRA